MKEIFYVDIYKQTQLCEFNDTENLHDNKLRN